jgi:hypothetical protein
MKPHDSYPDPILDENETIKEIRDVEPGDALDLWGDTFADPTWKNAVPLQFEYIPVTGKERETDSCIRLDFEGYDSVGFPPDHRVVVATDV